MSRNECLVWGALAMTLRVTRWGGVAPIRLVRERSDWRASVSRPLALYSYTLLLALQTLFLSAFVYNLSQIPPTRSMFEYFIDTSDLYIGVIIVASGLMGAPSRMKRLIKCLNVIEKIQTKFNFGTEIGPENNRFLVMYLCLIAGGVQVTAELYKCFSNPELEVSAVMLYFFCCMYIVIAVFLEMQFICLVMLVSFTLRTMNDSLQKIISILDIKMPQTAMIAHQGVRSFVENYPNIYDVMRTVDSCYGKVILVQIVCIFMRLVILQYYLVSIITFTPETKTYIVLMLFYNVLNITLFILIVEPAHRNKSEMTRTRHLTAELLQRVSSPRSALALELDRLYTQILLNKHSYQPMGLFTLTRPLIPVVLEVVITYLITVLQFQKLA